MLVLIISSQAIRLFGMERIKNTDLCKYQIRMWSSRSAVMYIIMILSL